MLLVRGESDQVMPKAMQARLRTGIPHAREVWIPAAGRLVMEEQPEATNAALLAFLDEVYAPERLPAIS